MTNKVRKALLVASKFAAITFVLAFGFGMAYATIDFIGTLNHMWVGNAFSVAVVSWIEYTAAIAGAKFSMYVVPVLKNAGLQLYAGWLKLFYLFGISEQTATLILAVFGLIADLCSLGVVIYFYMKRNWRCATKAAHPRQTAE